MSIRDVSTDIIVSICYDMIHADTKNTALAKLKKSVLDSITEFKITWDATYVPSEFGPGHDNDMYEDNIEYIIYINIKNLNQKDKDTIICDYGMVNAIKLLHDYNTIIVYDTPEEVCNYMNHERIEEIMPDDMIDLIVKDIIGFRNMWRNA